MLLSPQVSPKGQLPSLLLWEEDAVAVRILPEAPWAPTATLSASVQLPACLMYSLHSLGLLPLRASCSPADRLQENLKKTTEKGGRDSYSTVRFCFQGWYKAGHSPLGENFQVPCL